MKTIYLSISMVLLASVMGACGEINNTSEPLNQTIMNENLDTATFGAGCFWCVEAIFQSIDGVEKVESGYTGGHTNNPTYKEICNGNTGHAEVCQITYDPLRVTFDKLLEAFWASHDPTTMNRQGADVGTQYRSVIYYHNDNQQQLAESYKNRLNAERAFGSPVITEISAIETYYPAEDYHQDYFSNNPNQAYCSRVIGPKLDKFKKVFDQ
ncbi:MAG: peptide-methionine (S)-S-oxide reductase [Granulosicoccus sp.]|jgi:peptide-methionine (S)-S-oxide reductase